MFTYAIERNGKTYELTHEEISKAHEVHVKNFYCNELSENFDVPEKDINDVADSAYEEYCNGDGRTEYECLQDAYDEYMSEQDSKEN